MKSFLIAVVFLCSLNVSVIAQNFSFDLKETLTIGQAESDSTEYLFSGIRTIKPDQQNRIFIADMSDNAIRIFDDRGHFIKKMGGRGRGPGEFMEITSITITDDNEIIVLDRFQNRVTFFNNNDELNQTETTEVLSSGASALYSDNENDRFFLVSRNYVDPEDEGYLLHHVDNSWAQTEASHLNVFEHFFDRSEPLHRGVSENPSYKSTHFSNNLIAVTPGSYTGTLSVLNTESQEESLLGEPVSDFIEEYNWEQRERYLEEPGFASSSGPQGQFLYKREGSNFGLVGNSDYLLHFYGLFEGNEIIPFLDIYNSQGELLVNQSLKDHDISFISDENSFSFIPHFLDENNILYASDYYYQGSFPAVRIFQTNLDELTN